MGSQRRCTGIERKVHKFDLSSPDTNVSLRYHFKYIYIYIIFCVAIPVERVSHNIAYAVRRHIDKNSEHEKTFKLLINICIYEYNMKYSPQYSAISFI